MHSGERKSDAGGQTLPAVCNEAEQLFCVHPHETGNKPVAGVAEIL